MDQKTRGFVQGFTAAALVGATLAFAGIYVPNPEGDWIRDTGVYSDQTDQINVLGDIAPGAAEAMFNVGLRLNTLAAAGKKQNWDVAGFEAEEIEEAFDRLEITRPEMTADLEAFLTGPFAQVITAIGNQDKVAYGTAIDGAVAACNSCHTLYGNAFHVVKIGKNSLPLKF